MAMKRIAAMLLTLVLLLSCVGCAQDGRKEPGAEKADLGLTAEVKPATDFTAKANAAVYDELDFDDKQEYEFATPRTDRRAGNTGTEGRGWDDPLESGSLCVPGRL